MFFGFFCFFGVFAFFALFMGHFFVGFSCTVMGGRGCFMSFGCFVFAGASGGFVSESNS